MRIALTLAACGVVVSMATIGHAGTPFKADVVGYRAVIKDGQLTLTVSSDGKMTWNPAQLTASLSWRPAEVREGETATARFLTTWEPDSNDRVGQLGFAPASFTPDKNGAFNGTVPVVPQINDKRLNNFAHWCNGAKKYSIPGQVQVRVDHVTGQGANPASPISLTVICTK